jgi:hypothetical protein
VVADVSPSQDDKGKLKLYPCRPDLQLSLAGYRDTDQSFGYIVTNVGGAPASASIATIEAIAPDSAASDSRQLALPPLEPGQSLEFYYAVGTGLCPRGLRVRASVALDEDPNPANNVLDNKVCTDVGQVAPDLPLAQRLTGRNGVPPIVTAPASPALTIGNTIAELAPGEHSVDLGPTAFAWGADTPEGAPSDCLLTPNPSFAPVGVWLDNCTELWETAVRFDFTQLDQIPMKTITQAELSFDEAMQTDYGGGCATALSIATSNWPAASSEPTEPLRFAALPGEFYSNIESTAVDVTAPVRLSLMHVQPILPFSSDVRDGFILSSGLADIQQALQPADGAEAPGSLCASSLSNIKLHLTYVIPDSQH